MFKGLKSKIAEETKKIQEAVVSQVGEGLTNLTRRAESGSIPTSANSSPNPQRNDTKKTIVPKDRSESSLIDVGVNEFDDWSNGASSSEVPTPGSSEFLESGEKTPVGSEESHFSRQRHDSTSSLSSVDNFFPSLGASPKMTTITSDVETDVESVVGSTFSSTGASKEQISIVLNKLQGRAANYREKYRQLAQAYKSLANENDKIRVVLTASQDKALRRIQELREEKKMVDRSKREVEENLRSRLLVQEDIVNQLKQQLQLCLEGKPVSDLILKELNVDLSNIEVNSSNGVGSSNQNQEKIKKLEDLLSRCKDSIKSYKEKMQLLTEENHSLTNKIQELENEHGGATSMSDFVTERTIAEYKQKLEDCENSFKEKFRIESENNALTMAQCKQEMHKEIENKDKTIEDLRIVIKKMESENNENVERLNNDLQIKILAEEAFEQEKKDLISELSQTKQASVKIVREEEEEKRRQLQNEMERALLEQAKEFESKFERIQTTHQEDVQKKVSDFEKALKDRDEQMQLALEERDLQKMAALSEHDRKNDYLLVQLESLSTEKMELHSMCDKIKDENTRLRDRIIEQESLEKQYESQSNKLRQQLDDLALQLTEKSADNDAQIQDLKDRYENDMTEQKSKFQNMIDDLKRNLKESESLLNATFEEKQVLEKKLDEIENYRRENSSEIEENSQLIVNSQTETDILRLKHEIVALLSDFDRMIIMLSQKDVMIDALRNEIADRSNQVSDWTSNDDLQEQIHILSQQSSVLNSKLALLEQSLSEKNSMIDSLKLEADNKIAEMKINHELSLNAVKSESDDCLSLSMSLREENDNLKQKSFDLNSKILDLEHSIAEKDATLERLKLETDRKVDELQTANEESLSLLKNEISDYMSRIALVNGENAHLKENLNNLECKLTENSTIYEEKTTKSLDHTRDLESQVELMAEKLDKTSDIVEEYKRTITQLNESLTNLQAVSDENQCLKEKLAVQEKNCDSYEENIRKIDQSLLESSNEVQKLKNLNDELRNNLAEKAAIENSLDLLRNDNNLLGKQNEDLTSALKATKSEIEGLKIKLEQTAENYEKTSKLQGSQSQEYRTTVDNLETKLLNLQAQLDEIPVLKDKIQILTQTNEDLTTDLTLKDSILEKLTHEKSSADDKQSLMKKKYDSLLKELRADLNGKAQEIKSYKETIDKLQEANSTFESKFSKLEENLISKDTELQSKIDEIASLQSNLDQRNVDIENMSRNAKNSQDSSDLNIKLTENIDALEKTLKILQNQLSTKNDEMEKLLDEITSLRGEKERLLKNNLLFDQRNSELNDLRINIQSLKEQLDEYKKSNDSLERQLIEKQIAIDELHSEKLALEDRQQVLQRKSDNALKTLQTDNKKLTENLKELQQRNHSDGNVRSMNAQTFSSILLDHANVVFNEPTEAEYLRNIVFRYMVERETLGKESVNLAKAIAAVLKLDVNQTKEVLEKEEARLHSWLNL